MFFFFFFFCIQPVLQANDPVNVLGSGLSLSCELTFCPYKASQDGGSWRKRSVKGSFHVKMTFWGEGKSVEGSGHCCLATVPQFPSFLELVSLFLWLKNPGGDKDVVCPWPSTGVVTPGSDPPP